MILSLIEYGCVVNNIFTGDDRYVYQVAVIRLIDGDTVKFVVDLGFDCFVNITTRLARINAPEKNRRISKVAGIAATEHLRTLLNLGKIYIRSSKPRNRGKYGRWIVEIIVEVDGEYYNVNDKMVDDGHAVYHKY